MRGGLFLAWLRWFPTPASGEWRRYFVTSLPPTSRIRELWEMWSPFFRVHPVLVICRREWKNVICKTTELIFHLKKLFPNSGNKWQRDFHNDMLSTARKQASLILCLAPSWMQLPLPVPRGSGQQEKQERKRETTHSHFSGGVMVMVCAVNSSSKYLVSVSDDTCGMNGGTSWKERKSNETYYHHIPLKRIAQQLM